MSQEYEISILPYCCYPDCWTLTDGGSYCNEHLQELMERAVSGDYLFKDREGKLIVGNPA